MRRYDREHPGELMHLDIKKLGRIGSVGHRYWTANWRLTATSASAGSSSMSASTMLRVSVSYMSCPMSARRALSPSSRPPLPIRQDGNPYRAREDR
ncbi:hypothetical protein MES5069_220163 [Mesorhizobium escarrei]|uniref:Uncharacterized protein n=1 Tax=Mesorhizobium escarrei TaxID=666018 RepID=A0ABN8JMZ3_9HYPH|nr:hypothetical protein MES5069_220163 [Mesorhizobium escarrei]